MWQTPLVSLWSVSASCGTMWVSQTLIGLFVTWILALSWCYASLCCGFQAVFSDILGCELGGGHGHAFTTGTNVNANGSERHLNLQRSVLIVSVACIVRPWAERTSMWVESEHRGRHDVHQTRTTTGPAPAPFMWELRFFMQVGHRQGKTLGRSNVGGKNLRVGRALLGKLN